MYRIDNGTAITPIPTPAAAGPNVDSFFTNGNPGTGVAATILEADWCNSVQEELCYIIEQSGATLSKTVRTQLKTAIDILSQKNAARYAASTTAANTYTATLSPVPTYTTGMLVFIKFTNHNTAAATINLNALGAKSITRLDGSALVASDIVDGMVAALIYDGTNFQLLNRATGAWANFTPTVTLAGGAGNTVPVYTTNVGRYQVVGNVCFVDVLLTGDGGAEGAGTGIFTVALPVTIGANTPSSGAAIMQVGWGNNGGTNYQLYALLTPASSTTGLFYMNTISSNIGFDGNAQNNTTRFVRLHFWYEV